MAFAAQHNIPIFDTLKYAKKLIIVGVPEKQAEVQAEAMRELIDDKLVTKFDLSMLEERLTARLILVEERIVLGEKNTEQRFRLLEERIKLSDERTNERFDSLEKSLDERFKGIDGRFKGIDEHFKSFDERFKGIDERFKSFDERFISLEKCINERITTISHKLLIKLGGLIVGSFVILGALIPLVVKLM